MCSVGKLETKYSTVFYLHRSYVRPIKMRPVHFPCTVCSRECETERIFCVGCKKWTHARCINIQLSRWKTFDLTGASFFCPNCAMTDGGYNFAESIRRYVPISTITIPAYIQGHPKKRYPCFKFAVTLVNAHRFKQS